MSLIRGRRILVTGGAGFLGRQVCRALEDHAPAHITAPRSAEFDLRERDAIARLFDDAQPEIVIHLAAVVVARRPLSAGLAASAQLGVPAAVASLGLAEGVLSDTVATAIVLASVISLGVCTVGVELLVRREANTAAGARCKYREGWFAR